MQNERLVVDYNSFDENTIVESEVVVPEGDSTLGVAIRRNDRTTGSVEVSIDGEPCGRVELPFMMRMISSLGASVGVDAGSPVSERYDGAFPFTGTLHEVEIQLSTRSRKDVEATAKAEMSRQ